MRKLLTSNLPFDEWTEVFGSERLTGALLDRPTHHVHILEITARTTGSTKAENGGNPQKAPDWLQSTRPWSTRRAHWQPPRCFASRNANALHEIAQSPPLDYRDNPQHFVRIIQLAQFCPSLVVHFYSGQWCTFTPAMTDFHSGIKCAPSSFLWRCGQLGALLMRRWSTSDFLQRQS